MQINAIFDSKKLTWEYLTWVSDWMRITRGGFRVILFGWKHKGTAKVVSFEIVMQMCAHFGRGWEFWVRSWFFDFVCTHNTRGWCVAENPVALRAANHSRVWRATHAPSNAQG